MKNVPRESIENETRTKRINKELNVYQRINREWKAYQENQWKIKRVPRESIEN